MSISGVCPGTVSPKYLVVKVSESARFNCIPDAGATYIQWYLSISGGQTVVGVFEQPSLVIDDAQLSIAGLYQCVWTTPNGNRNQSSGLLVVLGNIHSLEK